MTARRGSLGGPWGRGGRGEQEGSPAQGSAAARGAGGEAAGRGSERDSPSPAPTHGPHGLLLTNRFL